MIVLPGVAGAAQARAAEIQRGPWPGSAAEVERVERAARSQVRRLRDGVVLYAGTNAPLDPDRSDLAAHLGMRPSLGWPAEKLQPGLDQLEEVEVLTARAVAATMRAPFAEVRPPSATLANLAVYAALTPVASTLAVLPKWAGGHASHHLTPLIRGHRIAELPYDLAAHDLDLAALPDWLDRHLPALIVLGGSLVLFPHRLSEISAVAAAAGVPVLYDASHTAGLIAGGRFQDPLAEGAAAVTFSTYKSYGGPPGGVVVARRDEDAAAISRIVHPVLTSNYDAGRLPRLHAAATELLVDGERYADECIRAARALAAALQAAGVPLIGADRGFTESHHLAIAVASADEAHAGVARLSRAGIYLSATTAPTPAGPTSALRLGTQELVRRGLAAGDMPRVATRLAAALKESRMMCDT